MRVLVHICCGPCSITVLQRLQAMGHEPVGVFFNPNIHPLAEYMRRRESAAVATEQLGIPFVAVDSLPVAGQLWGDVWLDRVENAGAALGASDVQEPASLKDLPPAVNPVSWLRAVAGREDNRCTFCWRIRLRKVASLAQAWDFPAITTTLLYSLYQDHDRIQSLGRALASDAGINFIYEDFRISWQEGINRSRAMGLYRQPYCGCVYSEYDRYTAKSLRLFAAGALENPALRRE